MNSFFKKIVSITLAATVLFTTTSYVVDMHFCCNELIDTSFLGNAKSCDVISKTENSKECSLEEESCCQDKQFVKLGNNQLKKSSQELETEEFVFLHAFVFTYINRFEDLQKNSIPFFCYVPPLIQKDIQVLHETFLI